MPESHATFRSACQCENVMYARNEASFDSRLKPYRLIILLLSGNIFIGLAVLYSRSFSSEKRNIGAGSARCRLMTWTFVVASSVVSSVQKPSAFCSCGVHCVPDSQIVTLFENAHSLLCNFCRISPSS